MLRSGQVIGQRAPRSLAVRRSVVTAVAAALAVGAAWSPMVRDAVGVVAGEVQTATTHAVCICTL